MGIKDCNSPLGLTAVEDEISQRDFLPENYLSKVQDFPNH